MGFKIERLEKIIEREISSILINSKDERLRFVTVTKVSLTNDCSIATLYYTILGNEEQKEATSKNLEKASGYIRSSLSKVLRRFLKLDLNMMSLWHMVKRLKTS